MRYPLIIGNWKLNGNQNMVSELILSLRKELVNVTHCNVVIAPPVVYLSLARKFINSSCILLGAQNVDINLSGAFTGEVSAVMLKDVGVKYVIIGHSERRIYHKESNELIAKKFSVLKEQGLIPVLCIGEMKKEREEGKSEEVCAHQIDLILKTCGISAFRNTVIAYEPIWAIGTGQPATPHQAQSIHKFIRNYIAQQDKRIAEEITIQYGGSVSSYNAKELFIQPDIDGVLVGNASLKINDFIKIIKLAKID